MFRRILTSHANELLRRTLSPGFDQKANYGDRIVRRPVGVYDPHGRLLETNFPEPPRPKIINSSSSDLFNELMGFSIRKRGARRKIVALEGSRLIEDALKAGARLQVLFLQRKKMKGVPAEIEALAGDTMEVHWVGEKEMGTWASVTTPPGIIGIFEKPRDGEMKISDPDALPLTLVCDNVREPGNLGSIIRTAAGAGCREILLSKGCVDPWEGKVVRGGAGAHFRIPITRNVPIDAIGNFIEPKGGVDQTVGILLADSSAQDANLPTAPYTSLNYTPLSPMFLFLGGETEGLSAEAFAAVQDIKTRHPSIFISRLHIPLRRNVESLNAANALGILLFEIRRQKEKY